MGDYYLYYKRFSSSVIWTGFIYSTLCHANRFNVSIVQITTFYFIASDSAGMAESLIMNLLALKIRGPELSISWICSLSSLALMGGDLWNTFSSSPSFPAETLEALYFPTLLPSLWAALVFVGIPFKGVCWLQEPFSAAQISPSAGPVQFKMSHVYILDAVFSLSSAFSPGWVIYLQFHLFYLKQFPRNECWELYSLNFWVPLTICLLLQ